MTQRIALLLAVAVYAASLTGCGCCRRVRDTLCRGAYCGSRAPILGAVRAPAPQPIVAAPPVVAPQYVQPQIIRPQVIQPQMQVAAPQCVPCQPACQCPTVVCDPCCPTYTDSGSCCSDSSYSGYAGYAGDCGCNAPYGINVGPGEYLGEVQTGESDWESSPTPADSAQDPGPGT